MAKKKEVKPEAPEAPEAPKNMINRKDLIEALTKVKPGLATKEIIEQSSYFIFEANRIWAYNDQIAISQGFKSCLAGAVKAEEFYKLLNKLNDEELEISAQEGIFIIKGKSIKAKIKIDPDIKLQPIQAPAITSKKWQTLPDNFNTCVSMCIFSASTNMNTPALSCLFVTGKTIFSTDGFRATKKEMVTKVQTDFLLPCIAAKELIKYEINKVFTDTEGWLHFTNDNKTMFSARIFADVKYPKTIWDFFKVEGQEVNLPDSFEKVIDRVSTLVIADFDLDRFVDLEIEGDLLQCKGKGPHGSISEQIKIDYKGKDIKIKVHPGFLVDILKQLDSMIVGERLLFKGENFEHCICLSS